MSGRRGAVVLAIALAVATAPPHLQAARAAGSVTYVVAPGGADGGPGTPAHPFASLSHAFTVLRAGDTLLVRGGTYDERIMNPSVSSGTSAAPVTVQAWPDERPVIRGLLWLRDANWWDIHGINVTWSSANHHDEHMVKLTDGVGWTFADAEVWGAQSYAALLVAGTPVSWHLDRLFVHDTLAVHGENQDHLVYVNAGVGAGVIENCVLAHSRNGQAIKVGGPDTASTPNGALVIAYNTMYDNRGPANVQLDYTAVGVQVYRNIMVGAARGRANVTAYRLAGAGNGVVDNIGWDSSAVVGDVDVPGTVVDVANRHVDPALADPDHGNFVPLNPEAAGYGA
jgi:hypothetical protein